MTWPASEAGDDRVRATPGTGRRCRLSAAVGGTCGTTRRPPRRPAAAPPPPAAPSPPAPPPVGGFAPAPPPPAVATAEQVARDTAAQVAGRTRAWWGRLDPQGKRPTVIVAGVLAAIVLGTQVVNGIIPVPGQCPDRSRRLDPRRRSDDNPGAARRSGPARSTSAWGCASTCFPAGSSSRPSGALAGVRLQKGSVVVDVRVTEFGGDHTALLAAYVNQILQPDSQNLNVGQVTVVPVNGRTAARAAHLWLFNGVTGSVEGELTDVRLPRRRRRHRRRVGRPGLAVTAGLTDMPRDGRHDRGCGDVHPASRRSAARPLPGRRDAGRRCCRPSRGPGLGQPGVGLPDRQPAFWLFASSSSSPASSGLAARSSCCASPRPRGCCRSGCWRCMPCRCSRRVLPRSVRA